MWLPFISALFSVASSERNWQSLRDGLIAWEALGFDKGILYVVQGENRTLFQYPTDTFEADALTVLRREGVIIMIGGARGDLLQNVTLPVVSAILTGKDPGLTMGDLSVSREELLARGGGVTMPSLIAAFKAPSTETSWGLLRDGLDIWASLGWDQDFSFNVGATDMQKRMPGASLSKWPAALTIAGLVADGSLSFDDKANKHLDWWSKDASDPRSNITLRHLLTFQSGYTADPRVLCQFNPFADFLKCARSLYKAAKLSAPPGQTWSYISIHLQFAAAMAVAASGLAPDQIFQKYLYQPLGMNGTSWLPKKNPPFAAGIITTGADFEKMLHQMLTYDFLGKEILAEMEQDWSSKVAPKGDGWFGHYGMGHWYDCMGYGGGSNASAPLSSWCLSEQIQAGPGAFGFFPLLDRQRGFYMQIVLREDPKCRSEIPEYLRIIAKPVVDKILLGQPMTNATLLESYGGLLLREIVDIYNSLPPRCSTQELLV